MKKKIAVGVLLVIIVALGVIYWPNQGRAPEGPTPATSTSSSITIAPGVVFTPATSTANTPKIYTSSAYGITFSYPPDWRVDSAQPIALENFNGKYTAGDYIPLGGAEIDIVGTVADGPVKDIIDTELMSAKIISTSTITVAGISCQEFFSTNSYAPNVPSRNTAVYCPGSKMLYKLYLSHQAQDPKGPAFDATFKQVLASLRLVK